MSRKLRLFVLTLLFVMGASFAQDYVPADLAGWQQWVLKDKEYRAQASVLISCARGRASCSSR
jgi:hypothetical protein